MARQLAVSSTQPAPSSDTEDLYATPRWAKVFGAAAALGLSAFVITRFGVENLIGGAALPPHEILMLGLGAGTLLFAIVLVRLTVFGKT